jgi:hypothetical protein
MRALIIGCLLFTSTTAMASEQLDLRLKRLPPQKTALSVMFEKAEKKLILLAEAAQHLGSHKEWVWVQPILGSTVGAQVSFDLK